MTTEIGPEAVTLRMPNLADQAQALTSDAMDGRDGVDASDAEPVDEPRPRVGRRRSPLGHSRPASPRGHR